MQACGQVQAAAAHCQGGFRSKVALAMGCIGGDRKTVTGTKTDADGADLYVDASNAPSSSAQAGLAEAVRSRHRGTVDAAHTSLSHDHPLLFSALSSPSPRQADRKRWQGASCRCPKVPANGRLGNVKRRLKTCDDLVGLRNVVLDDAQLLHGAPVTASRRRTATHRSHHHTHAATRPAINERLPLRYLLTTSSGNARISCDARRITRSVCHTRNQA